MHTDLDKPALVRVTKREMKKAAFSLLVVPIPAYAEATRRNAVKRGAINDYRCWGSMSQAFKFCMYSMAGVVGFVVGAAAGVAALETGATTLTAAAYTVGLPWFMVNGAGAVYKTYYDARIKFHAAGKIVTKASNKALAKTSEKMHGVGPYEKAVASCKSIKNSDAYRKIRKARRRLSKNF